MIVSNRLTLIPNTFYCFSFHLNRIEITYLLEIYLSLSAQFLWFNIVLGEISRISYLVFLTTILKWENNRLIFINIHIICQKICVNNSVVVLMRFDMDTKHKTRSENVKSNRDYIGRGQEGGEEEVTLLCHYLHNHVKKPSTLSHDYALWWS